MFKNCEKSVCSTNSMVIRPNPKKVTVLRHSKSESAAGDQVSNQGTNLWLRNGGVLPLVSVDPTSNKLSSQHQQLKQSTKTMKSCSASNSTKQPQARLLTTKPTSSKGDSQYQGSLKSFNTTYTLEKTCGDKLLKEKEVQIVFDKENYMGIISHFNEPDFLDVYNPAEYCEINHKHSPPCAERVLRTASAPEKVHYSEKAKAEILHSIREELKSWRNED